MPSRMMSVSRVVLLVVVVVSGEVFLVNVKGVWGVDEELVDLVIGR